MVLEKRDKMQIKCVLVGYLQANCYIVTQQNKAVLIDPGDEPEKIESELQGLELVGILLTHSHFDHIGALSYFEEKYRLKHNNKIKNFDYETIETPGHSKDSLTFYFPKEKVMFTGDFLFQGTIGRMDLPGGNEIEMQESLEKIKKYEDDIILYPGYGPSTTINKEKPRFSYYF